MRTFLALPLVLLFSFLSATATEQEADLIILEGEKIYADQSPGLKDAFPSLDLPEFSEISTANYKGYRPTWATFDGHLYLVGLEARIKGESGLLGNSKVLKGVKFPIPVTEWSGIFKEVKNIGFYDPNNCLLYTSPSPRD